jgi:hypothetical protein
LKYRRSAASLRAIGHAERLDDIVVGAALEQTHLLVFGRDYGENDDRHVRPGADPLQHFSAVKIGQCQIQDDQVRRAEGRNLQCFGGVLGFQDYEAVELEAGPEKAPDFRFVVDQENDVGRPTHSRAPPTLSWMVRMRAG